MDKFPKIVVNVFVLKDGKLRLRKSIGKTGYGMCVSKTQKMVVR